MRRRTKRILGVVLFVTCSAKADDARFQTANARIREDGKNDIVTRTSAALSLGESNDERAVDPLCASISDSDQTVRLAAVIGTKHLGRSRSLVCLRAREPKETDPSVKAALANAIETIAASDPGVIKENPTAKYYVALSTVGNATSRPQADVDRIVLASLRAKFDAVGTMQLAPPAEAPEKARDVIKKRKVKAFYLSIAIDPFDYGGGNLRVTVKLGIFNYPNRTLLGSFDKSATAQGVRAGDRGYEDRLLELTAGLVGEHFAKNAASFVK